MSPRIAIPSLTRAALEHLKASLRARARVNGGLGANGSVTAVRATHLKPRRPDAGGTRKVEDRMNDPKSTKKSTKGDAREHTNRTKCVERVITASKMNPGVAVVWRMLLDGFVTYTRGCPAQEVTASFERIVKDAHDVSGRAVAVRQIAATGTDGLDGFVHGALAVLEEEGLVRLGTDKRKRFDMASKEFVLEELPWVWPLPIEAWPEQHFLAALALRVD
jgi:hypothetical protein